MKKRLRELLKRRRTDEIAELAARKRRVFSSLISLTYDAEALIGWRAVEAMGAVTRHVMATDPDYVRDHLRRLHWLLSEESGGICWRAPEAMAEIICQDPEVFADYAAIVVSLLYEMADEDLEHFRPGVLWAIGRLGAVGDDRAPAVLGAITSALDHSDPQVRGMAVWSLGRVGHAQRLANRPQLLDDDGPVELYEDGSLHRSSVKQLTRQALRT